MFISIASASCKFTKILRIRVPCDLKIVQPTRSILRPLFKVLEVRIIQAGIEKPRLMIFRDHSWF